MPVIIYDLNALCTNAFTIILLILLCRWIIITKFVYLFNYTFKNSAIKLQ